MIRIFLKNESNSNTESAICLKLTSMDISNQQVDNLIDVLTNYKQNTYSLDSLLEKHNPKQDIITIGPLNNFKTSWCSNVTSILKRIDINVDRVEFFRRYTSQYLNNKNITEFLDPMTEKNYNFLEFYSDDLFDTQEKLESSYYVDINNLEALNQEMGLSFDEQDIKYYKKIFKNKKVTNVELYDLAQSNSEHSRHWFFNGNYVINNKNGVNFMDNVSLFKKIKSTNDIPYNNSVIAFKDNASAIMGYTISDLIVEPKDCLNNIRINLLLPTHTAETHNFPTGVCPFPGASTGTGGRIRDTIAVGKGARFTSSYVGYSVGHISNNDLYGDYNIEKSKDNIWDYPYNKPIDILIKASNGASDYGNKIGEPVTLGYTRSYGGIINNERIEYVKPIMYCGGIGSMIYKNKDKEPVEQGYLIVRVGGPAYNIGLGGGSASSRNQDTQNKSKDFNAVQRGDPQMENRVARFVEVCSNLEPNPILSIHDQGSGGMGNVTKEIVEPLGAIINLNKVNLGDPNLSSNVIWNAEYQEQCTILIKPKSSYLVKMIAQRENVPIEFIGFVSNTGNIEVINKNDKIKTPINLNLKDVLNNIPTKYYYLDVKHRPLFDLHAKPENFILYLEEILQRIDVGSKRFLTNKVDRSVSGLIAQQQCVGPFQVPLSNYSITSLGFFNDKGIVASIGEQPLKGLVDINSSIDMAVGEMLTNLVFSKITKFEEIKCLGNWMWSPKIEGEGYLLYQAGVRCVNLLKQLEIGIDGGKDSLSMNTKIKDKVVMSPNTFVISCYVLTDNINLKVTPDLKSDNSSIIFIDLAYENYRVGGSQLGVILNNLGSDAPTFMNPHKFKQVFIIIQELIKQERILSGHDRSDGGLITTLIEMSISSPFGICIDIDNKYSRETDPVSYFMNEELGLVIEVDNNDVDNILEMISLHCPCYIIGKTNKTNDISVEFNKTKILNNKRTYYWNLWEKTSFKLDEKQCNPDCVDMERKSINIRTSPKFNISDSLITDINNINFPKIDIENIKYYNQDKQSFTFNSLSSTESYSAFSVAIIREEGSNGDREMSAAFYSVGFNVVDLTMNDIINNKHNILLRFNGVAFVGGFSFSDALGSSIGWSATINLNPDIKNKFDEFYKRTDTFSLGICNGCQLMSQIGWIPPVRLVHNDSGRFESRCVQLKVLESDCIFTKNMENTIFNIWSSHGEGKFVLSDDLDTNKYINISKNLKTQLAPMRYVDDCGNITNDYPFNPNGSIAGIASICSKNGRHLAIMPHPERCFLKWQLPYMPDEISDKLEHYSPWIYLFKNAYNFCKLKQDQDNSINEVFI